MERLHRLPAPDPGRERQRFLPITPLQLNDLLQKPWTDRRATAKPEQQSLRRQLPPLLPMDAALTVASSLASPSFSLASLPSLVRTLADAERQKQSAEVEQLYSAFHAAMQQLPTARFLSLLNAFAEVTNIAVTALAREQPSASAPRVRGSSSAPLSTHGLLHRYEATLQRHRESLSKRRRRLPLSPYAAYLQSLAGRGDLDSALQLVQHMEDRWRERQQTVGAAAADDAVWPPAAVLVRHTLLSVPAEETAAALTKTLTPADSKARRRRGRWLTTAALDAMLRRLLLLRPSGWMQAMAAVNSAFDSLDLQRSQQTLTLLLHTALPSSRTLAADVASRIIGSSLPRPSPSPALCTALFRNLARDGLWDRILAALSAVGKAQPRRMSQQRQQRRRPASPAEGAVGVAVSGGRGDVRSAWLLVTTVLGQQLRREASAGSGAAAVPQRGLLQTRRLVRMSDEVVGCLWSLLCSPQYRHAQGLSALSTFLSVFQLVLQGWGGSAGGRVLLRLLVKCGEWQQPQMLWQLAELYQLQRVRLSSREEDRLHLGLLTAACLLPQSRHLQSVTAAIDSAHAAAASPVPARVVRHWLSCHLRSERWPQLMQSLRLPHSSALATATLQDTDCCQQLFAFAARAGRGTLAELLLLLWSPAVGALARGVREAELEQLERLAGQSERRWVEEMQQLRGQQGSDQAIAAIEQMIGVRQQQTQ